MASSELELAQNYFRLTQKVLDTKKAELVQAIGLVQRLKAEVADAERELESAKSCMHRVERELEVIEIDENDCPGSCDRDIGLPLVPTHPMRTTPSHSHPQLTGPRESPKNPARLAQLLIEEQMGLFQNKTLPSSLRRCLKRHRRKLVHLCEERERKERSVEPRDEKSCDQT